MKAVRDWLPVLIALALTALIVGTGIKVPW